MLLNWPSKICNYVTDHCWLGNMKTTEYMVHLVKYIINHLLCFTAVITLHMVIFRYSVQRYDTFTLSLADIIKLSYKEAFSIPFSNWRRFWVIQTFSSSFDALICLPLLLIPLLPKLILGFSILFLLTATV